jgi:hypothetical protein
MNLETDYKEAYSERCSQKGNEEIAYEKLQDLHFCNVDGVHESRTLQ